MSTTTRVREIRVRCRKSDLPKVGREAISLHLRFGYEFQRQNGVNPLKSARGGEQPVVASGKIFPRWTDAGGLSRSARVGRSVTARPVRGVQHLVLAEKGERVCERGFKFAEDGAIKRSPYYYPSRAGKPCVRASVRSKRVAGIDCHEVSCPRLFGGSHMTPDVTFPLLQLPRMLSLVGGGNLRPKRKDIGIV
jgi:hypothetical protein